MTTNTTTTTYRSEEIVPFRRPKGDLDSRYMPQVYAMVRNWASNPAQYGEGVLASYRQPAVNLAYRKRNSCCFNSGTSRVRATGDNDGNSPVAVTITCRSLADLAGGTAKYSGVKPLTTSVNITG